jgi:hypothetical protein
LKIEKARTPRFQFSIFNFQLNGRAAEREIIGDMTPEFPLRIIFDDGEMAVIETPEELLAEIDTIDSTDPRNRVWIRDANDRTVRLRMRAGMVELIEVSL